MVSAYYLESYLEKLWKAFVIKTNRAFSEKEKNCGKTTKIHCLEKLFSRVYFKRR
jgi:hypothetical protein